MTQTALLCGCGGPLPCIKCARRARLNRERFGGLREQTLIRDEGQCQVCGELEARLVLVHHRQPGQNSLKFFVTLCRACHVRVHFTARPSYAFVTVSPFLYVLWREVNRRQPEQLLLLQSTAACVEQRVLFGSDNAL